MSVLCKNAVQLLGEVYSKVPGQQAPEYKTTQSGRPHEPKFLCKLTCPSLGTGGSGDIVSEGQARTKRGAERAAAEQAVWQLREREGIAWPAGAFHTSAVYQPGEELPRALAMLAGESIRLTEDLIRTLSGEQVALVCRQLARPQGTPSPSPSPSGGKGTGSASPADTPMGSGLEGILFPYGGD